MASGGTLHDEHLASFTDTKEVKHFRLDLDAVGSQKRIHIPKRFRGFKIRPITNDCSFGVNETPNQPDAGTDVDELQVANWKTGGYAVAGEWTTRQLPDPKELDEHILIIRSNTADTNVIIEIFR